MFTKVIGCGGLIIGCSLLLFTCSCSKKNEDTAETINSTESAAVNKEEFMSDKIIKTDEQWRKELTEEQYRVTRQCGTEPAFTGKYYNFKGRGVYLCVACGNELFSSETKFDSGTGWPSFYSPVDSKKIENIKDDSHFMVRTEVRCNRCGAHLGHVFDDGPAPTGLRYCINSASLDFKPDEPNETR